MYYRAQVEWPFQKNNGNRYIEGLALSAKYFDKSNMEGEYTCYWIFESNIYFLYKYYIFQK